MSDECSIILILFDQFNLVITRKSVHRRYHFIFSYGVNELVDVWERVEVLGADLIEIGVIDAHAPLSIALFDQGCVSYPLWASQWLDEVCV